LSIAEEQRPSRNAMQFTSMILPQKFKASPIEKQNSTQKPKALNMMSLFESAFGKKVVDNLDI
jgi:hypothetical protein